MSPSGPTPFYADSPHGGDFFKRGNIDTLPPPLPITPPGAAQQKTVTVPGAPAAVATAAAAPKAVKPATPKAPSRPPSPRKEFVYPPPVFAPA